MPVFGGNTPSATAADAAEDQDPGSSLKADAETDDPLSIKPEARPLPTAPKSRSRSSKTLEESPSLTNQAAKQTESKAAVATPPTPTNAGSGGPSSSRTFTVVAVSVVLLLLGTFLFMPFSPSVRVTDTAAVTAAATATGAEAVAETVAETVIETAADTAASAAARPVADGTVPVSLFDVTKLKKW